MTKTASPSPKQRKATSRQRSSGGAGPPGAPKVIIAGWCTVDPKLRDEAVEHFQDMVVRARRAPGCLDFAMTADSVDPNRVNLLELWQSEEALKAWRAVCGRPKKHTPLLEVKVQKHVIERSGKPF